MPICRLHPLHLLAIPKLLAIAIIALITFINELDLLIFKLTALLETQVACSALASLSALGAHCL